MQFHLAPFAKARQEAHKHYRTLRSALPGVVGAWRASGVNAGASEINEAVLTEFVLDALQSVQQS